MLQITTQSQYESALIRLEELCLLDDPSDRVKDEIDALDEAISKYEETNNLGGN